MSKTKKNKKQSTTKGHWLYGVMVFAILLGIDLITKIGAQVYFDGTGKGNVVIIPDVLEFTWRLNPGMAFGMGSDAAPLIKIGIIVGTALVMTLVTVYYFKIDKRRVWLRWCFVFIVAGGVGNLIDRLLFKMWMENGGGVRDMVMLDFGPLLQRWFGWEVTWLDFGVCNFADFFIVGGAVALMLGFLFFDVDAFLPTRKYKALAKELEGKERVKAAASNQEQTEKAGK